MMIRGFGVCFYWRQKYFVFLVMPNKILFGISKKKLSLQRKFSLFARDEI